MIQPFAAPASEPHHPPRDQALLHSFGFRVAMTLR
jgi:hypothetical protein